MPHICHTNQLLGVSNLLAQLELTEHNEVYQLNNNDMWTLYLVDIGTKGLHWMPYKCISTDSHTIVSSKQVIHKACNLLNNIKDLHATQTSNN